VVVVILLVGGAFVVLDRTGALGRMVGSSVQLFHGRRLVAIWGVSLPFVVMGALENMHEEIIAMIPALLVLGRGLRLDAVTVLAMSLGAAVVGSAFGPTNPFQAGIANTIAKLPLLSGMGLRLVLLLAGTVAWLAWTTLYAARHDGEGAVSGEASLETLRVRDAMMVGLVVVGMLVYVFGVLRLDWGFNELSAVFLVVGVAIGLLGGLGLAGTFESFVGGMRDMLAAALLVGIARGISVALTDGMVIDTILHGLAAPLHGLPAAGAAVLMAPVQGIIHVAVPTVSGQAVLTMPIMAPLADLLGFSRDAAVLAYSVGAGLMDAVSPTNGAMLAMLLAARVDYTRWLRFAIPGLVLVAGIGLAGVVAATG